MFGKSVFFSLFLLLAGVAVMPVVAQQHYPDDKVLEEVNKAMERYNRARETYEAVKRGEVPPEILERTGKSMGRVTPEALEQEAARELESSRAAYDGSKIKALSNASGRPEGEIRAMRESGKGWGAIAKELDVHPSALGKRSASNVKKKDKKVEKGKKGAPADDEGVPGEESPILKGKGKSKSKSKGKGWKK